MTIRQVIAELQDARLASEATDKRAQWGVFGVLLVAVVVASAWILGSAAGVRRPDVGVSALWRPDAIKTTIDAAISDALKKDAVSIVVSKASGFASIQPKDPKVEFDSWSAAGEIAELLTSEGARNNLANRLVKRLASSQRDLVGVFQEFRRTSKDTQLAAGVTNASAAADKELKPWFDEILPDAALAATIKKHHGALPSDASVRDGIWLSVHKRIWETKPAQSIVDSVKRRFETERLDDAFVPAVAKDYTARLLWTVAGVLFVTAALVAISGGIARLRGLPQSRWKSVLWKSVAAVALVSGYFAWAQLPTLGSPFLSQALRHFNEVYELQLDTLAGAFNGLAVVAVVMLLGSSWASFLTVTQDARHLRLQLEALRWSLNIGTALLVAGVIEVFALSQWPAAFASDAAATSITTAASAAAGAVGVLFSLILLLVYLPGSQELRERAAAVIEECGRVANDPNASPEQKKDAAQTKSFIEASLTATGFDGQTSQQLMRFAQALLPLLVTATLSPLLTLLGN